MIDTLAIYNELRQTLGDEAAGKMAQIIQGLYQELSNVVTKQDFDELKAVVKELAEAQKRTEARVEELAQAQSKTEARLDSLTQRVEELAEAQRKTETRLDSLTHRVQELAEAQKRTEARVEELAEAQRRTEARVEELAEAQKRTETKVEQLAEAQKRTEARVEELAEAQKRTEVKLEKLIGEHKKTREELGGLSHTVGYRLEDEAIWALPDLLKKDFDIEVIGNLRRGYIELSPGKYFEVNIWGEARRDSEDLLILGEAKSQLKKKDVTNFAKRVSRLSKSVTKKIFPVLITYQTSPQVQQAADNENIKVYFSFQLRPTTSSN